MIQGEPHIEVPVLHPPPLVLEGQTLKQPVVWRCRNPECKEISTARYYEFEGEYPECPKCKCGPPTVSKRALIHLLIRDNKGPIVGEFGLRWKMACDHKRVTLATEDNGEAASGDSSAINCPTCLSKVGRKCFVNGVALKLTK